VEPELEGGGKAPAWLKGEGLEIWRKRAPMLRAARLLQAADELVFARYCRNFADWLDARKKLDKQGFTYEASTTHGGQLRRVDPLFMVADRLERQLLAIEDRFGMNPAERQRIMAQRAAGAGQGQLPLDDPRAGDPATPAAQASEPIRSPIGILTH
jgi:P27 family predicted phage terminase small subunit